MNDRNTSGAAAPTDFSSVRNPPTNFSSSSDRPPDYSTCVSQPTTVGPIVSNSRQMDTTHNSHQTDRITVNPMSGYNASESFPLKGIHRHDPVSGHISHDTTSSAPFLDVAADSENLNDGINPRCNPYNPQPAYNPSYPAERQITPRPNVYGRKTIVLQRTDADINARNRKLWMAFGIGLLISIFICGATLAIVFSVPIKRTRWEDTHKTNDNYDSNSYDRSPHQSAIDPYLTDTYRSHIDEEPWKPPKTEKPSYPSWDDSYKDIFDSKPSIRKDDDDAALRAIGIDPDEINKQLEILKNPFKSSDDIVHEPSIFGGQLINAFGKSRQQSSNDDETTKSPPFQW